MTFDPEGFSGFKEGAHVFLSDADLTAVDELENGAQFGVLDVFEDDDGMRARVVKEQRPEVTGTSGQHDLVALDGSSSHGQCYVGQCLRLEQLLEHTEKIGTVVVPAQAVLLTSASAHPISALYIRSVLITFQISTIDFQSFAHNCSFFYKIIIFRLLPHFASGVYFRIKKDFRFSVANQN